jgi:cyclic beta-1,2-glucan glucanotransferase
MASVAPAPNVVVEIEEPIVGELFSADRLEQHAESLAAAQAVAGKAEDGQSLIERTEENARSLLEYYRATAHALQREQIITPAEQWLVENFYIVEDQLREIRDDLPIGFYRRLPKLASGHLAGYPRVYGIAWAFVAHTDSRLDPQVFRRFVNAYQRVQPLSMGELWAVAITLRIVLVENLRRLAGRIVFSRQARHQADQLADALLGTGGQSALSPAAALRQFEKKPLDRAFAVQLIQRLRDLDPKVGPILLWLDERLAAQGTTADDIVRAEHQQQAAMTVTVRNVITSMRWTSAFDWHTFFENVSLVDQTLRSGSNFGEMDFGTRDAYRHAIEDLSRGSELSELEIAELVVRHAKDAASKGANHDHQPYDARSSDPGYYLIAQGRPGFEREIGFRVSKRRSFLRWYVRSAVRGYLGTIALFTAAILAFPVARSLQLGLRIPDIIVLTLLAVVPASELAVAVINRLVTNLFKPRPLPRLEFTKDVPADLRTIIVIPSLLSSTRGIAEQIHQLEIHYLANQDGDLRFALLSDWIDAPTETLPTDQELLAAAAGGIANLNKRHGPAKDGGSRFFVFHRRRVWNESEQKWMGWERKRGKLHELNLLLRGSTNSTFIPVDGHAIEPIPGVRYIITLDADTRLPRGTAVRLAGTMAHPLNRPEFSREQSRVVAGYGIIQPRVTPCLPMDHRGSIFQRVFSGPSGIDPYSSAVSDVYQDLFQEGSYTGKGIYDIDAFEAALAGKVRENVVLSHDLFEGIFARAALVNDVELFDDFPSHYEASAARQHRWARGDWQLLPWILGWGNRLSDGRKYKIPVIGRWKMLDNLRRSLLAPCVFLVFLASWLLLGRFPWLWIRFILATIVIPPLIPFFAGLNPRLGGGISNRSYFRDMTSDLSLGLSQAGLALTFMAYQAWLMSDAILRTLFRLFITRKNLLEWVTAAQAKHGIDLNIYGSFQRMSGGIAFAVAALIAVWFGHRHSVPIAIPFVLLWVSAPAVAHWISLSPKQAEEETLSTSDTSMLRAIARRAWRFFETFVSLEDHWLPPDNFQEDPKPVVAHRTSPTNIGLYLLATMSARDFGWLGTHEMVERVEPTLQTMGRLEKFRGHLCNWYDTLTLLPLEPKYISSVDSGNLAGDLLTLAAGCRQLIQQPAVEPNILAGVQDSIVPLREALDKLGDTSRLHAVTPKQLRDAVNALADSTRPFSGDAADWGARILELFRRAQTVADMAQTLAQELRSDANSELHIWAQAAKAAIDSHLRDARVLLPWLRLGSGNPLGIATNGSARPTEWTEIEAFFRNDRALADAPERFAAAARELADLRDHLVHEVPSQKDRLARIEALMQTLKEASSEAAALRARLQVIATTSESMFYAMDFGFLFDRDRKLLSIGYRVSEGTLDENCYDLLASEARLASFIAIAKGDIPASHWFKLGRPLTQVGRASALISWSGSMFEYLMPAIIMPSPANSLLSQTYHQIVLRQIEYGAERGVPWGMSESAFSARSIDLAYNYSGFGVPGLGLKRGLNEDLVIAPYATALAAMIEPTAAVRNFERLARAGGQGAYGFYEALDYTRSRLPEGEQVAIVRTYMAHHQGMSIVALDNVVSAGVMRHKFHSQPIVQASELLLQERTPKDVLVTMPRAEEVSAGSYVRELLPATARHFKTPQDVAPRTALLSNGRYVVMLTAAGSGYSRWKGIAITRWREDVTRDCWGSYFYLHDDYTAGVWSAGYQPTATEPDFYEAIFHEDHAEFVRRDRSITTSVEVMVSSEDDAELRRISISNGGIRARDIQVTSFAEIALTAQATDEAHPAFSNLFVETEFVSELDVLLATRRQRSEDEPSVWAAHLLVVDGGETVGNLQYETDRVRFIGRTRTPRNPVSIMDGRPLSNTVGPVLDPIMSLRRTVRIPPGRTVHLIFATIVGATREAVLDVADKYRDAETVDRTRTLAWTQSQVQLRHLGIGPEEAHLFQRLANAVLYSDRSLRPPPDVLARTTIEKQALWSQGISGDLPIVMARIGDTEDLDLIHQLLRAHEYWRMKQLSADVVIVNEKTASYIQELQGSLEALVRGSQLRLSPDSSEASGKIYLLRADLVSLHVREQIEAAARVVLVARRGPLSDQIARAQQEQPSPPLLDRAARTGRRMDVPLPQQELQFFNGLGGFTLDGREYVVVLSEGLRTPEPWINVIANPEFGFVVSESGSGFTWFGNSHENQLTPWSNDHVTDSPGEAIYLRDEHSGEVWTPTALPIRDENATYVSRHGQGYSRFHHGSHGILLDLVQFVPLEDPIKVSRLTLQNESGRTRRISVTAYAEWVLGTSRSASAPHIITEVDPRTGALLARSAWTGDFGGRIAFADLAGTQTALTADRAEFLGRNGAHESPEALELGRQLSGRVGAALDPCAVLQRVIELRPGARVEIKFFLGQAESKKQVGDLLDRYRAVDLDKVLGQVTGYWSDLLSRVQVATPDPSLDLLLNHWLLYQTLSCRMWARAAFYQLSGAYGFRDQLQDVMALTIAKRGVAREHLLRAARHQFVEGDVQHWWHPPSGRGVRTRISDDLLWLPYVVINFIEATGDTTVLEEVIPFIEGPLLADGQKEDYFEPRESGTSATLFEHCARALDRSLAVGSHGLPLMGTGDWNDGMNQVGQNGKGESIWLGWFLHSVLWEFSKLADDRGERKRAETWRLHVTALKAALEREGWDGEWYRRAYFDDGTPLGTAADQECRIDSIAQSWGIMTGAAEPARGARAMAAVDRLLVRRTDNLVLLLTPPFDHTPHNPGYIKGYVPGIRENGGQYTHAAIWTVAAFAAMSDGDRAHELFRILNPINRTNSRAGVQRYKVEPYVVAGDVYAEPPHVGRGGWTWYTGAAGWLYRTGLEWILGFRLRGMVLGIDPCIPRSWPRYSVKFRYHSSTYNIQVENPSGVTRGVVLTELDGKLLAGAANIPLEDDGAVHLVRVVLG